MMASGREPMKVVIISTKYVETDAASFKSVVQELTGKESRVTANSSKQQRRSRFYGESINKREGNIVLPREVGAGSRGDSILTKNLPFKELEMLIKEIPPLDDLSWNID